MHQLTAGSLRWCSPFPCSVESRLLLAFLRNLETIDLPPIIFCVSSFWLTACLFCYFSPAFVTLLTFLSFFWWAATFIPALILSFIALSAPIMPPGHKMETLMVCFFLLWSSTPLFVIHCVVLTGCFFIRYVYEASLLVTLPFFTIFFYFTFDQTQSKIKAYQVLLEKLHAHSPAHALLPLSRGSFFSFLESAFYALAYPLHRLLSILLSFSSRCCSCYLDFFFSNLNWWLFLFFHQRRFLRPGQLLTLWLWVALSYLVAQLRLSASSSLVSTAQRSLQLLVCLTFALCFYVFLIISGIYLINYRPSFTGCNGYPVSYLFGKRHGLGAGQTECAASGITLFYSLFLLTSCFHSSLLQLEACYFIFSFFETQVSLRLHWKTRAFSSRSLYPLFFKVRDAAFFHML